jgi:hypothetical protein
MNLQPVFINLQRKKQNFKTCNEKGTATNVTQTACLEKMACNENGTATKKF